MKYVNYKIHSFIISKYIYESKLQESYAIFGHI